MGPQSWKTSSSASCPPNPARERPRLGVEQGCPAWPCQPLWPGLPWEPDKGRPGESDQTQHQENLVRAWALFPTYWMTLENTLFPVPHLSNE